MSEITFRYSHAPTGELSGASMVEQTEQALSEISREASQAETDSAEALRVAQIAETHASEAQTTATTAQETATAAGQAAATAQSTATQAVTAAQGAQAAAQGAAQTAQAAARSASAAQTAAENAATSATQTLSQADQAVQTAAAAQTAAEGAQTAAESAATSATQTLAQAEQAQTAAASSAQSAADAQTAAQSLANGVVRFDSAQSLTDAQKAQARANIAPSFEPLVFEYVPNEYLSEDQFNRIHGVKYGKLISVQINCSAVAGKTYSSLPIIGLIKNIKFPSDNRFRLYTTVTQDGHAMMIQLDNAGNSTDVKDVNIRIWFNGTSVNSRFALYVTSIIV